MSVPICKIRKVDDAAIVPSKTHESDVGYDLTIIKEFKRIGTDTISRSYPVAPCPRRAGCWPTVSASSTRVTVDLSCAQ